jgi:methylmalonyl-CoA mutase cobalamin-binding subunit
MTAREVWLSKFDGKKFKRIKSKMIMEALKNGACERGNHKMSAITQDNGAMVIEMLYRGTTIAEVKMSLNESGDIIGVKSIYAGTYEGTVSTMRQRKDLVDAVHELTAALEVQPCFTL